MADAHCRWCGVAAAEHRPEPCRRQLDPPRFCPTCGRRLRVQVHPTGWAASCRDHGPLPRLTRYQGLPARASHRRGSCRSRPALGPNRSTITASSSSGVRTGPSGPGGVGGALPALPAELLVEGMHAGGERAELEPGADQPVDLAHGERAQAAVAGPGGGGDRLHVAGAQRRGRRRRPRGGRPRRGPRPAPPRSPRRGGRRRRGPSRWWRSRPRRRRRAAAAGARGGRGRARGWSGRGAARRGGRSRPPAGGRPGQLWGHCSVWGTGGPTGW